MTDQSIFGIVAGILSFAAFIPYILAILKNKNRPNRATWLIWTVLGLVLLASYIAVGATDTIWVPIGNQIGFFIIVALSVRHGEGGVNRFDIACLLGAVLGLVSWWLSDSPLVALLMTIAVDLIGALPTIKKSYLDPGSENITTWLLFSIANFINILAIGSWTIGIAAYPAYLFLISLLIFLILCIRKYY
ncbi:MAG: hypothetical protein U0R44_06515 [Candidatus Micrarchaeia archaeon]